MPFTTEQFLQVFEEYNHAVFPIQAGLILLAALAVVLAYKRTSFSDPVVTGILAFFWIWSGVVYHLFFFTAINPAAYLFSGSFILEGCFLAYRGILKRELEFRFERSIHGFLGAGLIVYSLLIYPLTSMFSGHLYPKAPTFGAPCPVTFFTFGILMWTSRPPLHLLVIPGLWAFVAVLAAVNFGMKEDLALAVAATIGTAVLIVRRIEQAYAPVAKDH